MVTRMRPSSIAVVVAVGAALLAACTPPRPAVPPPPSAFSVIAPPAGAESPGTNEWYWAPAPTGKAVTLGVYRPTVVESRSPQGGADTSAAATSSAPITLLLLNGADGFRRTYEDLAQRFAARGFITVVGCWYDHPYDTRMSDAIDCADGPTWKGMNQQSIADLDALVAATKHVPGVDASRLVIVGHSYGGGVAALRAAFGRTEPVVTSSGLLARDGFLGIPLVGDEFPADFARNVQSPVLVTQGRADGITPLSMAQAFVANLPPSNPATTIYYDAPAGHAFPWQTESAPDLPGAPLGQRYVDDVSEWIGALFAAPAPPTDPSAGTGGPGAGGHDEETTTTTTPTTTPEDPPGTAAPQT